MFRPLSLLKRNKAPDKNPDQKMPRHVAIIMDGNGRWATRRGLPRTAGHRAGMEALKRVVRAAAELGIEVLTLYAFSTENWKRPENEVEFLMRLPSEYLKTELRELVANNIRLRATGELDGLPRHTREAVLTALKETEKNTGMILNLAVNYGARSELLRAVREIAREVQSGRVTAEQIDSELLESKLYTSGLPDPDLLIRPSGESRLSNFLLWQVAYTELWFTDIYWPDFDREHLLEAIREYQKRDRRFGGIKL